MADDSAPVVAFFDVDGTLTCRDNNDGIDVVPTPAVREAVRRFVDRGNLAVVCTGRSPVVLRGLSGLPFGGVVALDGTHVVYDDQVIYERVIDPDLLERTISEMRRVGMGGILMGKGGIIYVPGAVPDPEFDGIPLPEDYRDAGGLMEFNKVDFMESSLEAYRSSAFLVSAYDYLNVGEGCHELVIPGTSKGVGGRALLDALPFEPSCVYAFGDSENDLEILRLADVAVVMGNARDVVKEHADYVTDDVRDDGVVTALEHFGLI